ncbi:hypothetical protein ABIE64_002650 [Thalassospira sp. MBR-102]|jgi:hypothetical protein|uniref:portal protein n=1 Tax=Thalassospira sp. MBR-102 TaxID=3156466 RepID=UPI003398672F
MADQSVGTAEARYNLLKSDRQPYLDRAIKCSELTLPMLITDQHRPAGSKVKTPYQSVGARGVNNLAAKLLLALLPPNSPFFRLIIDRAVLKADDQEELKTELDQTLADYEKAVMEDIETAGVRPQIFEGLKHMIVGGNILFYDDDDGTRAYPLNRYVVKRDPMGSVLEIITHEQVAPDTLEPGFLSRLKGQPDYKEKSGSDRVLNIYTHVKLYGDQWQVYQECMGQMIPGTSGTYPKDACPFIPLRFNHIDGEDYGRGYVEEILGDLKTLEGLTKAITEGAAAAAKVLILVKPNGSTRPDTISKAPNGAVRSGDANDVSTLQLDKFADFRVAYQVIERIEERLAFAFLLNTSIQRNGERVTAEEIRYMAGELEDALGGVYSILSQEFQLPFVNVRINRLQREGKLPVLPKDIVKPTIVTGVDALGRGHDRNKLVSYLTTLAQAVGPQAIPQYHHVEEISKRLAMSEMLDHQGLIKTREEIQQEQQAQQQQAMLAQFGPEAMKLMAQTPQATQGE